MSDIRLLIGTAGRQSKALQKLARVMGERMGISTTFLIKESYRGEREKDRPFLVDETFTAIRVRDLLSPVIELAFGGVPWVVEREADRLKVTIDVPDVEMPTVAALADMAFPLGRSHGKKLDVRIKKTAEVLK